MRVVNLVRTIALLVLSSVAVASAVAMQRSPSRSRDVERMYESSCANCHDPKLSGAQGPSLVDDEWKHGSDDASIAKSIRDGQPATGMPPFGGALSAEDIRALVIYIREEGARARGAQTTFAKPAGNISVSSELHAFRLETVSSGVDAPWGLAFLPDGRILVTEKRGRLRTVERGVVSEPIRGVPAVYTEGQAGLLDVALHPDFETNGWIYLSYSDPGPNGSAMTAVVRGHLRDGAFIDQQRL